MMTDAEMEKALVDLKRMEGWTLSCMNRHHGRCGGNRGPHTAPAPCLCPCHSLGAHSIAAEREAKRWRGIADALALVLRKNGVGGRQWQSAMDLYDEATGNLERGT